jgi:hypothetical protein
MSISDDHAFEQIHPQRFRGVKALSTHLPVEKAGTAYVELYVLPWEMPDASISLYGRGGTRICALTDLQAFKTIPWVDQRLEGYIRYDRLKRTADKTAVVQDQVFGSFVDSLRRVEPRVRQLIEEISAETQERRFGILLTRASRLIDRFLRYREKGLLEKMGMAPLAVEPKVEKVHAGATEHPAVQTRLAEAALHTTPRPTRAPGIKIAAPSQEKADYRSWYDPGEQVIVINREHQEFLLSQREDRRCLRYLFYVWVKETLLQEYGEQAAKVADEMVGLLAEAEPLLR